jgi:DNA mismatch repair protein MutL
MMSIRQLTPDVAAKIAAGEVVERPASVVKELIENSIDAGATQIRVDLGSGGLQLIRVTDNGCGIASEELPLALARHATSKVSQIDDLERIHSLGFRGEALASIAAVADVTLLSRPRGLSQGAQIEAQGGMISPVSVAATAEGTTITVRNLFSAVPARLKFLKSRSVEVSHCHHLLEQYALAYPEIRFSVFSEGRQIFATPGDGRLSSVLVEVYGLAVAEQMIAISGNEHPEDPQYPVVHGYVSRPQCYKNTRQHISFFVNRRWVLSRMLTAAVEGAYHSLLLTGRHPIAVVNIQIDPTLLDVNVHPAKTEIRFLKERRVFAAILRAVRAALLNEPEMPTWRSGRTGTGREEEVEGMASDQQTEVAADDLATAFAENEQHVTRPKNLDQVPMDSPWITVNEEETGSKPPQLARLWQSHIRSDTVGTETRKRPQDLPSPNASHEHQFSPPSLPSEEVLQRPLASPPVPDAETRTEQAQSLRAANAGQRETEITAIEREEISVLEDSWLPQSARAPVPSESEAELLPQAPRRLPRLRVVGQVAQSYIVTEGGDGMYLIDQHAAHERILLERMVASLKTRTSLSQLLLHPIELALAPNELEAIEEHQQQLERIGFAFAVTEENKQEVRAIPSVLVKQMNSCSLHELIVELTSEESLGHTETWEERALANVACKAAIKANYFLTVSEMREMLEQLERTQAPFSCCHGRPTMVHFDLPTLARAFERR